MREIRLVACDMDGTFLTSSRIPHPANVQAVRYLTKSGVIFCLASGRGISTMRPLLAELGQTGPLVSSNGALVTGLKNETVFEAELPSAITDIILDYAEAKNIHVNRYHQDSITFSQSGRFADLYATRTGLIPIIEPLELIRQSPATKLLFIAEPDQILSATAELQKNPALQTTSLVNSEPDYLEFLPGGINKGLGLQKLAAHLDIPPAHIAAIGDWYNDLEMLQWVGYPACVSNAAPEILQISQYKLPTNDEAGVSTFLNAIIEAKSEGIVLP